MARAFETSRFSVSSAAVPVAANVGGDDGSRYSRFSVSDNGVLAYDSSSPGNPTELVWFDRTGRKLGALPQTSGGHDAYSNLNLSPDGMRVAFDRVDQETATRDIWLFDLARGGHTRLTFDPATDASPVWAPDGGRVIFFSARDGAWNLYEKLATGAGKAEAVLKSTENKISCDWSADDRFILFRQWDPKTRWDMWALPLDSPSTATASPCRSFERRSRRTAAPFPRMAGG
jgi:dipeptidyl aminopeptidase/acylaminoacyl peptidase